MDDYENYSEDAEEWIDDEEDDEQQDDEILTPHDLECIRGEIGDLEKFRDLAYKIRRNSKAEQLFEGLNQGFSHLEELGAPKKALIFTESRRTQDFLFELLERRGYKGQVVLFNGSNSDKLSKQIYSDWKERNAGTPKITGSATADKRAAIVDHFRDNATIMIATEAAAEGINLQFCSLVVNYDMPWNPQRIEQRIGRCHRYGQKFDVVVINFLNKANAADVRVYELLDQKFQLFNGVFGTSDEVLGAIGNGVDFEKRIALIYQQCRTPKEIAEAFDQLQRELQEEISDRMVKARTQLLENFDDSVKEKLRTDLAETRSNLSRFEAALWQLTRNYYADKATFCEADHSFIINRAVADDVVNEDGFVEYGRYVLPPAGNRRSFVLPPDARPFRIGSPLAKYMIAKLKATDCKTFAVEFDYTHSGVHVALLEELVGKTGWLMVDKLTINSFEKEDYFLFGCVTDEGAAVYPDVAEKMLALNGRERPLSQAMPEAVGVALGKTLGAQSADITTNNADRNEQFFDEEMDKLDHWAEDLKRGLEKEIRDLDAEIKLHKYESKRTSQLAEKLHIQRKIKDLEKLRSEKRLNLYHAQDEVDERKEALLSKVEAMLAQRITQTNILTIRYRIA